MPGVYHILANPGTSAALDGLPDPPDDEKDALLTPEEKAARKRRLKFRGLLDGQFGPARALDEMGGVWSADNSLILIETEHAYDVATLPAFIQALVVVANLDHAGILAYKAANAAAWEAPQ